MTRSLALAAAGAALLGGCAMIGRDGPAGAELYGRTVRVETSNSQVTMLDFAPPGDVRATFGRSQLEGHWAIEGRQLCFDWPRAARECWPYERRFRPGETLDLTSSRGNRVRVTLL
jgi:hypothetical protein